MDGRIRAIALLAAGLCFCSCTITREAEPVMRTVTVTETGSTVLQNDRAVILMSFSARSTSPVTADEEAAVALAAARTALAEEGITPGSIRTVGRDIVQDGTTGTGRSVQNQYLATHTVAVLVNDITRPARVMDAALRSGARIQSVSFSGSTGEQAKKQARLLALNRAEETANTIATANGFTLGKLLSLEEKDTPARDNAEGELPADGIFQSGNAAAGSAGVTEISVTVTATYELN